MTPGTTFRQQVAENNPLQVVLTCTEKLALVSDDNERSFRLHSLLKKNIEKMRKIIHKFQNITQYATKDYVDGKKIIDIDAASSKTSRK